ncbi:type II toxin-antitoxin system VapC family toxin [Camelimonas abortus]|uniref:Ribonuclease VapC n=1 Tax=Camelimonas abortus TaxID=1017184 RepID=A0ABV7LD16_9HYPH
MIVLSTDVVYEAMKPAPDAAVVAWLNDQAAETLYITAVTLGELLFGIQALPQDMRRDELGGALNDMLELFRDRVLPFDADAARHYAQLAASSKLSGQRFLMPNGYIAAIAASRGFVVVARDAAVYEQVGVSAITPWLRST